MRINPTKKIKKSGIEIERYTRKAALVVVFLAVYFFFFKILFL